MLVCLDRLEASDAPHREFYVSFRLTCDIEKNNPHSPHAFGKLGLLTKYGELPTVIKIRSD